MSPITRLTDQQIDETIDEAIDQFIQELGTLTAQCDWAVGNGVTRLARINQAVRREVALMMTYREPRG